jgi:phospholipid/cholesterol/gamma-HCH transport system substrate-binding protein
VARLLRKSFLERNQRLIGVIGVFGLLGASMFALLLSGGVFARTYSVKAYFTDAAGVVPGDKVTVAGLDAGTVKGIDLENGLVAVDLGVSSGVELPKDSSATIVIQTLLGKRVVDLKAGQSKALLESGDAIPVERTTTPVDITELNDISVRLLNESDAQAFNKLLDEVSAVTNGERGQVTELIDGLNRVLAAVDDRRTELSGLIDALKTLSTALADKDTTILSLIDRLNIVLGNLAARQDDLKTLLVATDSASHETADLISRNRSTLDSTLVGLHDALSVLANHQLDLAATIDYVHQAVQGYASVGYSCVGARTVDSCAGQEYPNRWANIFVESLGPLGVDVLLGQCGVIDGIIDQMLGTDCSITGGPKQGGNAGGQGGTGLGGNGGGTGGGLPMPVPSLPLPTPSIGLGGMGQDLPGNVGDLVDSVLQGIGGKRK